MSNSNNSSSSRINVPEAKQGMEQFKMQAANEVGVNLKNGRVGLRWGMSRGWST